MNNNCPNWTKHDLELFNSCSFYVSGVAVTCVAVPGLILNVLAICILSTRFTTKNNFNQLVVSLFVFDSIYLFSWFVENFRRNFDLSTNTHVILLPKILYPMFGISLSASIFMTVAIAHERYIAIKQPFPHLQAMRSAKYRRINLMKYIFSTTICAIIFHIPKFFEVEIEWVAYKRISINETARR